MVKLGILPPNLVISANKGFRCFLIVLGFYFLSIYMFCSHQRQIGILSIKLQNFSQTFLWRIQIYYLVNLRNSLWIRFYYSESNSLVYVHQREHHVCFLQASAASFFFRFLFTLVLEVKFLFSIDIIFWFALEFSFMGLKVIFKPYRK